MNQTHIKTPSPINLITSHMNLFKFLFTFLLLGFTLTFTILFGSYSHIFSFNIQFAHLSLSSYPLPSPPLEPPAAPKDAETIDLSFADVSDEEVIWSASMVPKGSEFEIKKVPKIAFMFLIKGSIPFAPLWEEFFKGHQGFYSIYVHSDASSVLPPMPDSGVFRRRRVPSQPVQWGKFNMVEAELRLRANALLDISNQRFVLLSESCIPLFNFPTIYAYLMNSNLSYVEVYDLRGPTGQGRYKHRLSPTVNITQWRKGSQWFTIDRDLAVHIIADKTYFSVFKRYCKSSCYADEHYFPTWVNMNFGSSNSNRSLTWADWTRGGSHPARYRRQHVSVELLERMRSGSECKYNGRRTNTCFLFARKFLPDSLDRLLRFAPNVMHF